MPNSQLDASTSVSVLQTLRRIEGLMQPGSPLPEALRNPESLFYRLLRDLPLAPARMQPSLPPSARTAEDLLSLFLGLSSEAAKTAVAVYAVATGEEKIGPSLSIERFEALRDWVLQERQAVLRAVIALCGLGTRSSAEATEATADSSSTDARPSLRLSGATSAEGADLVRESIVNVLSGINGAKAMVDILLDNIERIVSRKPLFLQMSQAEPALSAGGAEFRALLERHEVASSSAALIELELTLDALTVSLVSGAALNANQVVRLVRMAAEANFQAPIELLQQQLPGAESNFDACGRIALAWTLAISSSLRIRASFGEPLESCPLFENKRLLRKELNDLVEILTDCVHRGTDLLSNASNEDWYRSICANVGFFITFVLGVYSSLTVESPSPVASRFNELLSVCTSEASLPIFGTLMKRYFPKPVETHELNSIAETIVELKAGIVQQLLEVFLIPVIRDVDAGKELAAPDLFPELISLSFRCNELLCREFWGWWRYFKSVPTDELIRWTYLPYLHLFRLVNQFLEASHERQYLMDVLSGLVCDSQSFDDCLALLAAPIVLKSWELQTNVLPFEQVNMSGDSEDVAALSPGDRVMCRRSGAREVQALGSLSSIIGRAPAGAVGIVLVMETDGANKYRYFIKWEDRCCSSWWGLCMASILANDSSAEFQSALKLFTSLMRFEGSNSLMNYLDEHYIDLFAFHVLQHLGVLDGAGEITQVLRSNNLHARAVMRSIVKDADIAYSIHSCSRLPENISIRITQAFKFYFVSFSEVLAASSLAAIIDNLSAAMNTTLSVRNDGGLLKYQGIIDDSFLAYLRNTDAAFALLRQLVTGNYSVYTVPNILNETAKAVPELVCALLDRVKSMPTNLDLLSVLNSAILFFQAISPNLICNPTSNPFAELFFRVDSEGEGIITRDMVAKYCIQHASIGSVPELLIKEIFFANKYPSVDLATFLANCEVFSRQEDLARLMQRFSAADYSMHYFIQAIQTGSNPPTSIRQEYLRRIVDVCIRCVMIDSVPNSNVFTNNIVQSDDVQLRAMNLLKDVMGVECPSEHIYQMQQLIVDHFIINRSFQECLAQGVTQVLTDCVASSVFSKYLPKSDKFAESESGVTIKVARSDTSRANGLSPISRGMRLQVLEKVSATLVFLDRVFQILITRNSHDEIISTLSFVASHRSINCLSVYKDVWSLGGAFALFIAHDKESIARTALSLLTCIIRLNSAIPRQGSAPDAIREFLCPFDIVSFVAIVESIMSPKIDRSPATKASFFCFLKNMLRVDSILLAHLFLVPSRDANTATSEGVGAKPPLGAGHRGSGESSQPVRIGALTAVIAAVYNAVNAQGLAKKEDAVDELQLLDSALSFTVGCWDYFRSNSSVIIANHVLYITENSALWSIVSSILLKDVSIPALASDELNIDLLTDRIVEFGQRSSIQSHCLRLSIMASAFCLVARERFGLLYAAEDIVQAAEASSSAKDGDASSWRAAGSSRKKVEELFRHCGEVNRFMHWLKLCAYHTYDIATVEHMTRRAALALGLNVSTFRRSTRSEDGTHIINTSSYVYDLPTALNVATSRGWRKSTQAFDLMAMPNEHKLWSALFYNVIRANSTWMQLDSHTNLMKNFRDFIEITVLSSPAAPNRSNVPATSSPGQLRRSPSVGLDSPRRNQPPLSPSVNRHMSGMPSPSAAPLLQLPSSMGGGDDSSFVGDRRSYLVVSDILKHLDRELTKWKGESDSVLRTQVSGSCCSCEAVPGLIESVALMTSMLHHQLKDVSVRTADPAQATMKSRDSKASRFDASQLRELLLMLCRVYQYLFDLLKDIVYIKYENCLNYWSEIWGRIAVDILSCIIVVMQAIGSTALDSDKTFRDTRCSAFKCIFDILGRELRESDIYVVLSDQVFSDRNLTNNRHKGAFENSYLPPSFIASDGYNFNLEKPGICYNKNGAEDIFRSSFQESLLLKRSVLVKLSVEALCQLVPSENLLRISPQMPSVWRGVLSDNSLGPYIDLIAELLTRLPVPVCDYSSWSSSGRGEQLDSASDDRSSYFGSVSCLLDLMTNSIDNDIISPEEPVVHKLVSTLMNCKVLSEYQRALLPAGVSDTEARRMAAFMSYDSRNGESSPMCELWGKVVRLFSAVIESSHRQLSEQFSDAARLPFSQVLLFFAEKYGPLLLLPLNMSSFAVSCGQLMLAKTSFTLFNALENYFPLWRTVLPAMEESLNKCVLSCVAHICNLLSEGKTMEQTARTLRTSILFVTEEEKRGAITIALSGNDSGSKRSSAPLEDDGIVRANSFDSTSTDARSNANEGMPNEPGAASVTISKPMRFAISIALDSLLPALSLLRNMLPCPLSSHTSENGNGCSHGARAQIRVRPEVGAHVAFMTKRWVPFTSMSHLTGDSKVDFSFVHEATPPVLIDVIERGKIVREVPLPMLMLGADAFASSFRSAASLDPRSAYVYDILLDSGSVEEGVSSDAIVAASVPLIPLTPSAKESFGQQFVCSNESLILLLCFITSDEMVHLRRGYRDIDSPGAQTHAALLDALLDAIAGHLLVSIAAVSSHIDATLNAPIDECQIGNLALQRTELCAQMNILLRCIAQRYRAEEKEAIAWFCTAEWTEFLSCYEPLVADIVRRNASPEFAALAFDTTVHSSPSQPEWQGKLTDGSLRTGPEYVDL